MEDLEFKSKRVIRFFTIVFIISLIIIIICLLMLKYSVEGEGNMPFEISQLLVISTAEGIDTEGENVWNLNLMQNNDVYLYISKNKNHKETEIIKSITLDNFEITNAPKVGKLVIYRSSSNEGKNFEYLEEYEIDDKIIYAGSEESNTKNLEIANQGGVIEFRICNNEIREIFYR